MLTDRLVIFDHRMILFFLERRIIKMSNYRISKNQKTVYLDFDKASAKEKEEAKFIAEANCYTLKLTKKKAKAPKKAVKETQKEYIIRKLTEEGLKDELKAFYDNCDSTKTHTNKKGEEKKNTYLYASSIVFASHPDWK